MTFSFRRIEGYRRRFVHEWSQWQARRECGRRRLAFQQWLAHLRSSPPQVMVGANFAEYGGVRGHLQAIKRYSKHDVQLAPPENLLHRIGTHSFTNEFREDFLDFPAKGVRVAHSHVFPWFIEWCQHHQKNGLRWIHTYHLNYYPEHGKNGEVEPWQQQINDAMLNQARFADECLSVSKWQVVELREQHGIEARYLPNGVDVAFCDQGREDRFRNKHQLQRFVLFVGRNDPVKNPMEFVKLARRIPEEVFVMIGGDLSVETLATVGEPTLPANLRILGGLNPMDVQDAIAASSLVVVTSKREGLPTLVLEAMTHETPLVVPDEAGCMEAIDCGRFGDIYHLGNIDDLERKVRSTIRLGRRDCGARRRVLEEYDWRMVMQKLDGIYAGKSAP